MWVLFVCVHGISRFPRVDFDTTTTTTTTTTTRFQQKNYPKILRMLQMSSQLPLTEAAAMPNGVQFAFASGLAVKGNTVIITYGAGDRDARALVMTLEKLDVPWIPTWLYGVGWVVPQGGVTCFFRWGGGEIGEKYDMLLSLFVQRFWDCGKNERMDVVSSLFSRSAPLRNIKRMQRFCHGKRNKE